MYDQYGEDALKKGMGGGGVEMSFIQWLTMRRQQRFYSSNEEIDRPELLSLIQLHHAQVCVRIFFPLLQIHLLTEIWYPIA